MVWRLYLAASPTGPAEDKRLNARFMTPPTLRCSVSPVCEAVRLSRVGTAHYTGPNYRAKQASTIWMTGQDIHLHRSAWRGHSDHEPDRLEMLFRSYLKLRDSAQMVVPTPLSPWGLVEESIVEFAREIIGPYRNR